VNNTGQIGDVCVPTSTMLYPSPDPASTHAPIFHMHAEVVNEYLIQEFPPNKKFYHYVLPKHVLTSHFLTMKYDHVTSAGDVIALQYCLAFVCN
jgi:hypothetical protein